MFKKILACLDGSELAGQILPYVTEQALRFDSRLILFNVTPSMEIPPTAGIEAGELMKKQAQEEAQVKVYLEQLVQKSLREGGLWWKLSPQEAPWGRPLSITPSRMRSILSPLPHMAKVD
jgi:hypothetical protein